MFSRVRKHWLHVAIAVNVSPKQFYGGQLVRIIESVLSETGLDPAFLEIEITEGLFIHEPANFIGILKNLKQSV